MSIVLLLLAYPSYKVTAGYDPPYDVLWLRFAAVLAGAVAAQLGYWLSLPLMRYVYAQLVIEGFSYDVRSRNPQTQLWAVAHLPRHEAWLWQIATGQSSRDDQLSQVSVDDAVLAQFVLWRYSRQQIVAGLAEMLALGWPLVLSLAGVLVFCVNFSTEFSWSQLHSEQARRLFQGCALASLGMLGLGSFVSRRAALLLAIGNELARDPLSIVHARLTRTARPGSPGRSSAPKRSRRSRQRH